MRRRLLYGSIAVSVALATAGPAMAAPRLYCANGFEAVCTAIGLTCKVTKDSSCHP